MLSVMSVLQCCNVGDANEIVHVSLFEKPEFITLSFIFSFCIG